MTTEIPEAWKRAIERDERRDPLFDPYSYYAGAEQWAARCAKLKAALEYYDIQYGRERKAYEALAELEREIGGGG